MIRYRVQLVAPDGTVHEELTVSAKSAIAAAVEAAGDDQLRSGLARGNGILRAKVYGLRDGVPTLSRFYSPPAPEQPAT